MASKTFIANGAVSRPSNESQNLIEHRKMGGISFDVRWGLFIPFSEELVAYEEPHPSEVSNVGTFNLTEPGSA